MRIFLAFISLALASLIIFWQPDSTILFWQENAISSNASQRGANNSPLSFSNSASQTSVKEEYDSQNDSHWNDVTEDFIPNPEAIASMRQARLEGDPRTPKLGEYHQRETPTAEELDDHEQHLAYERRQQKRVYRAYVDASKIKTAQLRSMIEKGKAEGVSAEEIAFAEEKIRGIEEMAITLQQDHPDIMQDSYQPPTDWLIESLGKDDNSIKTDVSTAEIDQ
ncbi:MAG: hypothetical protein JKY50_09875 [Oleispira sp.]|nr:hypothetical protein [Oleispira sp.]